MNLVYRFGVVGVLVARVALNLTLLLLQKNTGLSDLLSFQVLENQPKY
jgi:hypothetical protein